MFNFLTQSLPYRFGFRIGPHQLQLYKKKRLEEGNVVGDYHNGDLRQKL